MGLWIVLILPSQGTGVTKMFTPLLFRINNASYNRR
nr:MAG TPA: hypothetical protein [Siphoviridae sp. ct7JV2]